MTTYKLPASAAGRRPHRLSAKTRAFAAESMYGKYGDEAMQTPAVAMDDVAGFMSLSPVDQYDLMLSRIVREAPIRVCEAERVCGAATLGLAIAHYVPATYEGKPVLASVSHVTLGFDRALKLGINGIRSEIEAREARGDLDEKQRRFLLSVRRAIDGMRVWRDRYIEATRETRPDLAASLQRVPFEPPTNYREAVAALWFLFAFSRLAGNWPGLGRVDVMLGDFLHRDLESGAIALSEARELLASLFVKGCEWIKTMEKPTTGDAQHYQNIVLGGIDESGREVTNEVTYLVLDIVEELGISDFPIAVRVSEKSPKKLLRKTARAMRHGGGTVAVYNEPLILEGLARLGYKPEDARRFANDGCWEVQVPGETQFGYHPFDALQILQHALGLDGEIVDFDGFEAVYEAFRAGLVRKVEDIYEGVYRRNYGEEGRAWREHPCPIVSMLELGCVENARSYYDNGTRFTVGSPHIGGAPDVANALLAIKKLVYEDKKCSLHELLSAVARDWEGAEPLRQYALNRVTYFGNDSDEADQMAARVISDFASACEAVDGRCGVRFPAGVSTFGRQIDWLPARTSSPHGKKRGEILAGNLSPTPGTDFSGATAVVKSYCKCGLVRTPCGAALDLRLSPTAATEDAILSLIQGFTSLGGSFMQIDVVNAATLRAAQKNPEAYRTLAVRISGWSARFVTLLPEWQEMVIERTEHSAS